jgi:hypothetical protein
MESTLLDCGSENLLEIIRCLVLMSDQREELGSRGEFVEQDLSPLAVQLLIKDQLLYGEEAAMPVAKRVKLVTEELDRLFDAARIIGRAYTSLAD